MTHRPEDRFEISFDDAILIAHALARFEGRFTAAEMPALERFADALDAKERWLAMFPPATIFGADNRVIAFAGKGRTSSSDSSRISRTEVHSRPRLNEELFF